MSEEMGLPSVWALAELGSFTEIIGGGTPSRDEPRYFGGDIVWLTPTEIPKETISILTDSRERLTEEGFKASSVRWIPEGSVLLTSRASIGYVAIAGTRLTTNQGFASFIIPPGIEPKFLGWWLRSQKKMLEELAGGTTFKEISKATLKGIRAPIAPLAEQQRIVAAIEQQFTRLDAGVAALKSAQTRLKRYRAAVLKAAVEGKLTEAWRAEHPDTEPASVLLQCILAERRARWEADLRAKGKDPTKVRYEEPAGPDTSDLPELPEGWCWATLDQAGTLQRGRFSIRPRNNPRYYNGIYPFLQLGDLPAGGGEIRGFKQTLNSEGFKVSREFEVGTVLVGIVGASIGNTGILTFRSCFPDSIVGITCQNPATAKYIEFFLRSQKQNLQTQAYASGGQPNINLPVLQSLPVPLPPLTEQVQIVSEVEQRLSVVSELETTVEANLKRAERLRQSILREAFAGRLVPQDPNDEPASVLLERIRRERASNGRTTKQEREQVPVFIEARQVERVAAEQVSLWDEE